MSARHRIFGCVALVITGLANAGPVQVEGVRVASASDKTRIALDISQPAEHKLFTLSNPHRVVIDIKQGRMLTSARPALPAAGVVRNIRTANREDGSVRIVLDLARPMKPSSFLLASDGQRGDRLVIDLKPVGAQKTVRTAAPTIRATPTIRTTATARATPSGRDIVVAIDAGHGGKDPGARGPSGVREKDVVLKISRRLAEIINADPNMHAYLTRSTDRFVNLRDRMERSRAASADLFISIHADAFRDRKVRGATVYVLSSKGAVDEAARRLADRENEALGEVSLNGKEKTLAEVLLDLSQDASLSASIGVGDEILAEIGQITKVRKKRVQQAPFLVLKSPDVPSVLIETAFISNPRDEKNLASATYRDKLARAIYAGITDYFVSNPPPGTTLAMTGRSRPARVAEVKYTIRRGDTLSGIANHYDVPVRRIRGVNNLRGDKIVVGKTLRIPATQEI